MPPASPLLPCRSLEECVDDLAHVELLEVGVLLPRADEEDGLARLVAHGQGCAYLEVHRVELGQDDAINLVLLACGDTGREKEGGLSMCRRRFGCVKGIEGVCHLVGSSWRAPC